MVAGGDPPPTIEDPGKSVIGPETVEETIVAPVIVPPLKVELLMVTLFSVPPLMVGFVSVGVMSVMFVSDPPEMVRPVKVAWVASNVPTKAAPGPAESGP